MNLKVNKKQGIDGGLTLGSAGCTMVAAHNGFDFVPEKAKKWAALGLCGVGVVTTVVAKNPVLRGGGVGGALYGGFRAIDEFTKPSVDASGNSIPVTGIKASIRQIVPQLNGAPTMGYVPYDEERVPALMGGSSLEESFDDFDSPSSDSLM